MFVLKCFSFFFFSPMKNTQILFCSDFSKITRMHNPHPRVTKGNWEHVACKTADTFRNIPCFKAVRVRVERKASHITKANICAPFGPNHRGLSLARRASLCTFRASPALPAAQPLPADHTQPGERGSVYLQGNCTSSTSHGLIISAQLKGKPCSRRSPSFSFPHGLLF